MILTTLIILSYIYFSTQEIIKNGVYNIMIDNLYFCQRKNKTLSLSENFLYPNTFFRIIYISNVSNIYNDSFYNIEEIITNSKLSFLENKELIMNKKNNIYQLWNFIKLNENDFIIKNTDSCYIKVNESGSFCETLPFEKSTKFKFIRIYSEVDDKNNYKYKKLIDKEPIDALIKYIDLRDPNLIRDKIHQIEKDYDNEELRYSIRSICKNIPWIRKIFILTPNEKVRYFKDYNLIKEKIVYIKDKDLIGYDSSNPHAFQYRLWKLKKFGISNNIIVLDDDYFIGNKLGKKDFFHVKNGKVVPSIITSKFLKIDKTTVEKNCMFYKSKAEHSKEEQNADIFFYTRYLTFSFILNVFNISYNSSVFIPEFTHNAIPINLKDLKELYYLIYESEYKYPTLDCLYRHMKGLQFQTLILSYTFIKYDREIKNIPNNYITIKDSITGNYKFSLFCINKEPGNYSYIKYYSAKIIMEYLFPKPSPYEIIDYSFINLSFNVVYSMNEQLKLYEKKISHMIAENECFHLEVKLILIFLLIFLKLYLIYKNQFYDNAQIQYYL